MDTHAHLKSLATEISAVKDRVQNLIGPAHWPTVGVWKESVLRAVLRRHLPSSLGIGSGFVVSADGQSTQIDVLIYDDTGPILFQDGDLIIVTPDVVRAVIEVKTRLKGTDLREVFGKIDATGRLLKRQPKYPAPFFGVYSYEEEDLDAVQVLAALQEVNRGDASHDIHCVSVGTRQFVRFWRYKPDAPSIFYAKWHSYALEGTAQAYFVHNVIDHLFPTAVVQNRALWYPDDDKESRIKAIREKLPSKPDDPRNPAVS
jgi:hypothetical protein